MTNSIKAELAIVAVAVLTGNILRFSYAFLQCLRNIHKHPKWLIGAEDLCFWIGAAVYVFVQIYYTNHGMIRLDFVLGIVVGSLVSEKMLLIFQNIRKKIYQKNKARCKNKLAK